jgi:cAMP phosphodiesterase
MPEKTYISVILTPKTPSNIATAISLTKGEVIKNDNVTPRGIPHLRKPIKSGIDEHVQKGVIAPKRDANIYSSP